MKQIKITPEEHEQLRKRFQVGKNYLWQVLSFSKNGPKAEQIRRAALQQGGRFVDPDFVPNCRTEYLGGRIVQTFADQVVLEIDIKTGDISLRHKGEEVNSMKSASMAIWNAMALSAQSLAEDAMVAR